MSTLARNECREQLRYNYTPDERREKGQQLADTHIRLGSVNDELDRIKADYKAKIQALESDICALSNQVSSGYEMREYVCFWEYDNPEKGKKTLRRKEPPCDAVRTEEMTIADRQTVMDEIDKEAAEAQPDPKDGTIVPFTPRNVAPAPESEAPIWDLAIKLAKAGPVSTSKLQRELKVAYNEAAALMERLRDEGVIVSNDDEDDELTWAAQLEAQRKQQAKEGAEKRKASKGRRTSSGGVVATEADGKDLADPDDNKSTH